MDDRSPPLSHHLETLRAGEKTPTLGVLFWRAGARTWSCIHPSVRPSGVTLSHIRPGLPNGREEEGAEGEREDFFQILHTRLYSNINLLYKIRYAY